MPIYRVPVVIVSKGYCEEEAASVQEVIDLVESGDYTDIYGETFHSMDIDESQAISMISDDGEEFELSDEDMEFLKDDEIDLEDLDEDEEE